MISSRSLSVALGATVSLAFAASAPAGGNQGGGAAPAGDPWGAPGVGGGNEEPPF
jgi:hypothetical protein